MVKTKLKDKTQKITKGMAIGEILEKYPQVVETLMGLGVHCIGCHVAAFESLEMGLKAHGLSDKEIDGAVKKLNDALKKSK